MKTQVVTAEQIAEIVAKHKRNGKVFGVQFIKKDGSLRRMGCRFGVTQHLRTSGTPSTVAHKPEYITVFSMRDKEYRNVSLSRLDYLVAEQTKYILA